MIIALFIARPDALGASGREVDKLCLSGICLGDEIASTIGTAWVDPYEADSPSGLIGLRDESFPRFEPLQDSLLMGLSSIPSESSTRLGISSLLRQSEEVEAEKRRFLDAIKGLADPNKFWEVVKRSQSREFVDLIPSAVPMVAVDGLAFCQRQRFAGYFKSESGHATTVGFGPIAMEKDRHVLVVHFIARSFEMEWRASEAFYEKLKKAFPLLVSKEDVSVNCGGPFMKCEPERPGKSKHPTVMTAAKRMFLRGHDQVAYYSPPVLGFAELELRLFNPNAERFRLLRETSFQAVPEIEDRFPQIPLSSHPLCQKPPAKVPSVE